MQRIFGALAVFGGWLCLPLSAVLGLVATEGLGLYHTAGQLPSEAVYGVPAVLLLFLVLAAAVIGVIPAMAATVATDPSGRLYAAAAGMAVVGIALLPDELGRAFALAILPGAALFAAGAWWLHEAGELGAAVEATVPNGRPSSTSVAETWAPASAPDVVVDARAVSAPEFASGAPVPEAAAEGPAPAAAEAVPSMAEGESECPWCSAPIAPGADRCPRCGAALVDTAVSLEVPIPGVTDVAPELRAYAQKVASKKKRPGLLSMILDQSDDRILDTPTEEVERDVIGPPSAEVRAEMKRLDREIAAGGLLPDPNPTADPAAGGDSAADGGTATGGGTSADGDSAADGDV